MARSLCDGPCHALADGPPMRRQASGKPKYLKGTRD
jgi:hypothetical protein